MINRCVCIEVQYTLGKFSSAMYMCMEESDSPAMHLRWSSKTIILYMIWLRFLGMFMVLTTYLICSDCKTKCHSFHSCL